MAVVISEQDGPVLRLRLNRPEKLNALSDEVREHLSAAVTKVADDVSIRVVVVEGAGRSFSAGVDLRAGADDGDAWAERRHRAGAWQRLLDQLEALPQVTVASVQGHCIGGAALLAVACDLRVGDPTIEVSIPELALGIPLTWGGVPRLAREVGLPLTRDLVMTGRVLAAEEALRSGFIQRLADDGQLRAATDGVIAELIAMPAAPLSMTKTMTAAIGRERSGAAGWADADLIGWARQEPDAATASIAYVAARLARHATDDT
jgi:enoyl-CoA hydratase/carnithine racemase